MRELIALALAVTAGSVGALVVYLLFGEFNENRSAQQLIENVQDIGARLSIRSQTRAGGHGDNAAFADSTLISFSLVPPGIDVQGGDLKTGWGGDIDVTGQINYIHIKVHDVPAEACRYVLDRLEKGGGVTAAIAEAASGTDTDYNAVANRDKLRPIPGVTDRVNANRATPLADIDEAAIINATTGCGTGEDLRNMWFRLGWL